MRFESFSYFYPPRPEMEVEPSQLWLFEEKGYVGQFKKNGTCNVMTVTPDRAIIARNRHKKRDGGIHKLWAPDAVTARAFHRLTGGWYVFVSELLHSKVRVEVGGHRHTNFISDILVADSEVLVGTTFSQRQELLAKLFPNAVPHASGGYSVIDPNTWLATNHRDLTKVYGTISKKKDPEDEGLVIKKASATLAYCTKPNSNSSWQLKCFAY